MSSGMIQGSPATLEAQADAELGENLPSVSSKAQDNAEIVPAKAEGSTTGKDVEIQDYSGSDGEGRITPSGPAPGDEAAQTTEDAIDLYTAVRASGIDLNYIAYFLFFMFIFILPSTFIIFMHNCSYGTKVPDKHHAKLNVLSEFGLHMFTAFTNS